MHAGGRARSPSDGGALRGEDHGLVGKVHVLLDLGDRFFLDLHPIRCGRSIFSGPVRTVLDPEKFSSRALLGYRWGRGTALQTAEPTKVIFSPPLVTSKAAKCGVSAILAENAMGAGRQPCGTLAPQSNDW